MKLEPIETYPKDRRPRVAFHVAGGRIAWAFLVMRAHPSDRFFVMENGRPLMAVEPNFWAETPETISEPEAA